MSPFDLARSSTGAYALRGAVHIGGIRHTLKRGLVLVAVTLLSACGGGGTDNSNPTSDSGGQSPATAPTVVPSGTVKGRVLSASTGEAVANARVTAGPTSATTDATGSFTLANVAAADRVTVAFSANGYAQTSRIARLDEGQSTTVNASLLPVAATQQVDPAAGATVSVPNSPAQLQLPANGLVRVDGAPISGTVTVELTPIPVSVNSSWMAGDFTASSGNEQAVIESFGAMSITIKDGQGANVTLAPGRSAMLRIPLSTRGATPPSSVPLFYFNDTTGRWVEEGVTTLAGSGDGRYYQGTITRIAIWNADQYAQTIRVQGCVVDEAGARVSDVTLMSDGVDYSGTSSARTDANGNFSIPIRKDSLATLIGTARGLLTNTIRVDKHASDFNVADCMVLSSKSSGINVKLTWGEKPSDLDSHLYTPDGSHVYFRSKGSLLSAPYVNLDVDDTTSYGPEVVTVTKLQVGTYRYYVHNYSGTHDPGMTGSPAQVELTVNGNTVLYTPAAGEGAENWWHVFNLTVDGNCNVAIVAVNTWDPQPVAASSAPTYCTPPQ